MMHSSSSVGAGPYDPGNGDDDKCDAAYETENTIIAAAPNIRMPEAIQTL